jgi:hypothetical protein
MYLLNHIGGNTETKGELHLLFDETDVNGDSKSTNEMGHPWLVRCSCRPGTSDFCSALAALYFFLTIHYFNFFVPISKKMAILKLLGKMGMDCGTKSYDGKKSLYSSPYSCSNHKALPYIRF